MLLIFDADGLIKLNRAGMLTTVAHSFECIVPSEVFYEAVTAGLALHHPDAIEIDSIVAAAMRIWTEPLTLPLNNQFGTGETAAWTLLTELADRLPTIVSDDRAFVRFLMASSHPRVFPSTLIVNMANQEIITKHDAIDALSKMRPLIRASQFNQATEALNDN